MDLKGRSGCRSSNNQLQPVGEVNVGNGNFHHEGPGIRAGSSISLFPQSQPSLLRALSVPARSVLGLFSLIISLPPSWQGVTQPGTRQAGRLSGGGWMLAALGTLGLEGPGFVYLGDRGGLRRNFSLEGGPGAPRCPKDPHVSPGASPVLSPAPMGAPSHPTPNGSSDPRLTRAAPFLHLRAVSHCCSSVCPSWHFLCYLEGLV